MLAFVALSAANALAQPANDNFANANSLDLIGTPGTFPDNNTGATRETGEPLIATNLGGASVWYTWTSPSNAIASFDTVGSAFDTVLGVYLGNNVSNLTAIAQDDNSGSGGTSKVTFPAPAGTKFYIAVDGSNGVQGNIVLNWSTSDATVANTNDNIASAAVLSGSSGTILDYNFFATPELFELFLNSSGTNSMWYTWTAPSSGVVTFDTLGSSFDTVLDIYSGTNQPTAFNRLENDDFLARRTSQISMLVTNGQVLRISVIGYQSAAGIIKLDWNLTLPPANDNFGSAANLDTANLWGSASGNNLGATRETGEPNHAGFVTSSSVWYKWTAPQDGEVQLDNLGSSVDTVLAVYTGTTLNSLSQVAANDDLFTTFPEPGLGQLGQINVTSQGIANTNIPPPPGVLTISPTNPPPVPNIVFGNTPVQLTQPFTGFPSAANGSGASGLRFNAHAGVTYYFAVDSKNLTAGPFNLNWAFHSSGVFRFATENRDATTGIPSKSGILGWFLYLGRRISGHGALSGSGNGRVRFPRRSRGCEPIQFNCPHSLQLSSGRLVGDGHACCGIIGPRVGGLCHHGWSEYFGSLHVRSEFRHGGAGWDADPVEG